MKTKSLATIALAVTIVTGLYSCSQDETGETVATQSIQKTYPYTMHLNCAAPTFEAKDSRAVSYSWSSGDKLYLAFTTNSSTIQGVATYQTNGEWKVETTGSLSTTTSEMNVNIRYFTQPGSVTNSTVALSETSALYEGAGKYTKPSNGEIYVSGTVAPSSWRMRFSGSQGTRVSLNANSNDIEYYYEYSRTSNQLRKAAKDVVLQVQSDGYTPYIYGSFAKSGNCSISVTTDATYRRTINSANLLKGQSGYMDLPVSTNYASLGWEKVDRYNSNCWIKPNIFLAFVNGYATDWTIGSDVAKVYEVTTRNDLSTKTDEELIEYVTDYFKTNDMSPDLRSSYEDIVSDILDDWFSPASTYYLLTLGIDKDGQYGKPTVTKFQTKSTSLPNVSISNIKTTDGLKWTYNIGMYNGAKKYYLSSWSDKNYRDPEAYLAWLLYRDILNGSAESHDWASVTTTCRSNAQKLELAAFALDQNGNLGNSTYATSSFSNSNRRSTLVNSNLIQPKEMTTRVKYTCNPIPSKNNIHNSSERMK